MQISVTDTVNVTSSDTVQKDTITIREYFLGKVIPVDSTKKSFPDTISSSDGSLAKVYTSYSRAEGNLKTEPSFNTDYAFGLLSVSLFMLALLSITGRKQVVNIISSLSFKRPFVNKPQSGIGVFSWAPLLVNLFSVINAGLFVTAGAVTMDMFGPLPGFETVKIVSLVIAALSVALLSRHIACLIIGSVSGQKEAFREYVTVITATWFISGFIFFCVSSIILFTRTGQPEMLILGAAGAFALLYFYRIIRLLIIFIRRSVTILYFILYLCALEVLPVLLLLKIAGVF
jgi:hypothetical protein